MPNNVSYCSRFAPVAQASSPPEDVKSQVESGRSESRRTRGPDWTNSGQLNIVLRCQMLLTVPAARAELHKGALGVGHRPISDEATAIASFCEATSIGEFLMRQLVGKWRLRLMPLESFQPEPCDMWSISSQVVDTKHMARHKVTKTSHRDIRLRWLVVEGISQHGAWLGGWLRWWRGGGIQ
jgi:hypothetical protein